MNDVKQLASVAAINAQGIGVRAEFFSFGNRYSHQLVAFNDSGESSLLLRVVEDRLQSGWPCSPVTQGLNLDDLRRYEPTNAPAAMLIGMAGDGHWSMTVESDNAPEACGLIVDVACRVKSLPPQLTSTYQVAEEAKSTQASSKLQLANHLGDFELRALPLGKNSAGESCLLELSPTEARFVAEITWDTSVPVTIQWRYGLWVN